jgi:two-component system, chemotaxis family, chemotaxis protein CheV
MADETSHTVDDERESELLEFLLGEQTFAVSVLKIEAIEQYNPEHVTHLPATPPAVVGTLLFRNRTIPLIDLAEELGVQRAGAAFPLDEGEQQSAEQENRVVLIVEFNKTTVAFLADGVQRIHRLTMKDINPFDAMFDADSQFIGSFHVEGKEVLIVDMERLVPQFAPEAGGDADTAAATEHPSQDLRGEKHIMVVEDSATARSMIHDVLQRGGYTQVTTFRNGQAACDALSALKDRATREKIPVTNLLNLVITDIEMPRMDGLTLCRQIKTSLGLADIPVVLYSTIQSDEAETARKDAGADAFISKPQLRELVGVVDRLVLPGTDGDAS